MNRRDFLKTLSAVAAGVLVPIGAVYSGSNPMDAKRVIAAPAAAESTVDIGGWRVQDYRIDYYWPTQWDVDHFPDYRYPKATDITLTLVADGPKQAMPHCGGLYVVRVNGERHTCELTNWELPSGYRDLCIVRLTEY